MYVDPYLEYVDTWSKPSIDCAGDLLTATGEELYFRVAALAFTAEPLATWKLVGFNTESIVCRTRVFLPCVAGTYLTVVAYTTHDEIRIVLLDGAPLSHAPRLF
jgi:tagatose-1,6-bisphosphate aldolase non-catalytic subunit AgaZ/GatZ